MSIVVTPIAPAAARNYDWLLASVAGWLHRTDLTAMLPDFVMLAEKRINADLQARLQNVTVTLTTTSGSSSLDLPDDLNTIRALSLPGTVGRIDYLAPSALADRYVSTQAGPPRHYTVIGGALTLGPTPDAAYALSLVYDGSVPALADVGGSNWLIAQHAEIYLAATMCEALLYTKDADALQTWEPKYQSGIANLNRTDWKVAGPMAVRADSTTP